METAENPIITTIHHISRRSTRRQLELDSGEAFSVDASLLTRFKLRVGMPLTLEVRGEMLAQDSRLRAKAMAFDLLRTRDFGRREIAERLRRKGFEADAVEYAVTTLEGFGYLSDERFAQQWVESRQRRSPRGLGALRQELRRKGIDRTTIDRTLMTVSEQDEREAALRAAEKQLRRYRTLPHDVARRRLYEFLLRRGFSFEVARAVRDETMGHEMDREE